MVFEIRDYALKIITARAVKRKTLGRIETTGEHARIIKKIKSVLICVIRLFQFSRVNFIVCETKNRRLRLLN